MPDSVRKSRRADRTPIRLRCLIDTQPQNLAETLLYCPGLTIRFVVRDLGSTNGIYLNGNRVQKEATISMGDDLVIGDVHFRMQNEATLPGKKKAAKNAGAPAPVAAPAPPKTPQLAPKQQVAPPSMDIPIAIPEGEFDFAVEATNPKLSPIRRKPRIDDVVLLNEDEEEDDEDG